MKRIFPIILYLLFLNIACSPKGSKGLKGNFAEIPSEAITPLKTSEDLDLLLDEIGEARIVMLGESSHGTSEFYTWRDSITRRLVKEKGFSLIGVEGDWEDASPFNRYIKNSGDYPSAKVALQNFDRWPQWMWANEEIRAMGEWLRENNTISSEQEQVGFYGLDVYGIWESLDAVYEYLEEEAPAAAASAREVRNCFSLYKNDEAAYVRAIRNSPENCSNELAALLETVEHIIKDKPVHDEAAFAALQNAYVAVNAEKYYRESQSSNVLSWNIRDHHMMETINRLLEFHGPDSKIIVWEHNTHVGDARATDMAKSGTVNVGQLAREQYEPGEVYIVGFGTYRGRVIAAPRWGATRQVMSLPGAKKNSWEWILKNTAQEDKIINLGLLKENRLFLQPLGHRAVGVVYDPGAESGNYVPSVLPLRYDAFIFLSNTTALKPLKK